MKETVIQFGEGNFLRGFADYFIHKLNEQKLYDGKVVIVQPIEKGAADIINAQKGVYNLYLRGVENGKEVCERAEIHSVSRCINPYTDFDSFLELAHNPDMRFVISNTTEAGIAYDETCRFSDSPASSFPAKLTRLLYERYKSGLGGFVMLACELIDNNGDRLKDCVLKYAAQWGLGEDFVNWINSYNSFCNTLVDRIVTGYPSQEAKRLCAEIGREDKLLDTAEIFHLWVIGGNFESELPLRKAGFNVVWTDDVSPYKKRKVRVLNGAHTSMVFPALLCGVETVGDCLNDADISRFLEKCLFDYILPMLGDSAENRAFTASVLERFANPFVKHQLKSISLNSVSKFKERVLPTAFDWYEKYGGFPKEFAFSLAALIEYYKSGEPSDSEKTVTIIKENELDAVLACKELWGADLTFSLPAVGECLNAIREKGAREALRWILYG